MNVNNRGQVLAGGTTPDLCKLVTLAAPFDDLQPQTQRTWRLCEQLQGMVSGARPNLNARETQELED
jgi:hypothetical protein